MEWGRCLLRSTQSRFYDECSMVVVVVVIVVAAVIFVVLAVAVV